MLSLPFRTITDFVTDAPALRSRRYGLIEVSAGRSPRVHLRPWPKLISLLEVTCWGEWLHRHRPDDCCWLYYNQPRGSSNYLALKYMNSSRGTRPATVFAALEILEAIAQLKSSLAIVSEATNPRISDRLLARHGWQRHTSSPRRNFIKRFYGVYPARRTARTTSG